MPESATSQRVLSATPLADDWALEAELRGVQRLVGSLKSAAGTTMSSARHTAHASPEGWHALQHASATPRDADFADSAGAPPKAIAAAPKSHLMAWMILSLGLATFACGAVLLGWSLVAQRDDLWPIGMPLALIGQAGLVLGLILQLDSLWHTSRKTAQTLDQLDGELSRVRHATTLLSTSRTSSAQSFYAHMAEGASPQLLLSDLKGQLDLLAQQMATQKKF
jgi:hypothetical protein